MNSTNPPPPHQRPETNAALCSDDTLIIFGGEFGRTPVSEGGSGRDHNPYASHTC